MIKKIKSDISASIKNKRINVFFLFLLLAFIILIFTKLSKEYTNTLAFDINKVNVPVENVILKDSNAVLNITLKTHGFKWLSYYFSKPEITLDFVKDVDKTNSKFIWNTSKSYVLESTQFGKQVQLLNISPDTLLFNYDVNMVKKVPVILNRGIKFSSGFNVADAYKTTPDSVQIIGPQVLVSKIKNIETELIEIADVKSDIDESVKLKLPEHEGDLKFSDEAINLTATVERFTEGSLKIPVTVKNVPKNIKIKYFPKAVNVTYYTSLNNFKSINVKDFKVECDYNKMVSEQSFLLPELTKSPKTVKHVKINQQHIEFIIIE